ncbi:MAG: DUF5615 family PIN-like protein [Nanoarchaeota archaeon]
MAKIRFIVDENVDFPVVNYLRRKGYSTSSIAEDYPSLEDIKILKIAADEKRVLLTNDKDFGNLVFKEKLKSSGLILLRLGNQSSSAKINALEIIIKNYSDKLLGNFIVISEDKIRIRKI